MNEERATLVPDEPSVQRRFGPFPNGRFARSSEKPALDDRAAGKAFRLPGFGPLRRAPRLDAAIPEGRVAPGPQRRDGLYRRNLAIADMLSASLAVAVGVVALGHDQLNLLLVLAVPFVLLIGKVTGLYDRDELVLHKTTLDEAPALFQVATLYALLLALSAGFVVRGVLTHEQLGALWLLLFASMLLARALARRLTRRGVAEERCLVIGDAKAAAWLSQKLESSNRVKARILGRVPLDDGGKLQAGPPALGNLTGLGLTLAEHDIERVLIAPGSADAERLLEIVRLTKSLGVKVSILPRLFEVVETSVEFDAVEGVTFLGLRSFGLPRSSRMLKRGMDVVGSAAGLALLAPVWLAIAISIKATSPGPVLFKQRRMGHQDSQFDMFKFRTMVEDAEKRKAGLLARNEAHGGLFKIANDPRLTRVGGFLRRLSIDELPQLINVLRGEMSLVGPRPLVIDEDRHVEGWHRRRLLFTPGMTGLWQIFGSARIPLHEMVKIDYLYGANWSLWLDVKILIRTLPFILARRGL